MRRDFRLADNPALRAAVDDGAVLPLFVLDPVLLRGAGTARRAWLHAALHALDADLRSGGGPGLSVVRGKPENVVPRVAKEVGAARVHIGGRLRAVRAAPGRAGRRRPSPTPGVSWSGPDPRTRSPRAP